MGREPSTFLERCQAHWTKERVAKVTAGRAYPITPVDGALLLRALGLLNADASMSADAVRKYGQINHLVALLDPALRELCKQIPRPRIVDAGCGSSYLSFLLSWCFEHRYRHPVEIFGVDANAKLIEKCRARAEVAELSSIRFEAAPLESLDWPALCRKHAPPAVPAAVEESSEVERVPRVNAVFALHACDTATDRAIALGLAWKSDLIAVAPCCHADLARRWSALAAEHAKGAFSPIWSSPHLRRETAESVTDAMRTLLLRGAGYEVTALEFVPSEHTPKNTLIRALRRGNYLIEALREYRALRDATGGAAIALEEMLPEEHRARLESAV